MKRISTHISLLVVLFVFLAACGDKETKQEEAKIVKAEPRPKPMRVYTADGVSVNAYDFSGFEYFLKQKNDTTYVVNFWATWCVPCVEELPHFEKLNEKYKEDKVKGILVSLDIYKMVESKLLPFIKEKQLKSEVIYLRDPDQNAWLPKVDSTWSGAIPATVIYNKEQRKFYEQSFTYEELEKEVSNFK
jgi:thiol-disulfide isomerase/thioredoxin